MIMPKIRAKKTKKQTSQKISDAIGESMSKEDKEANLTEIYEILKCLRSMTKEHRLQVTNVLDEPGFQPNYDDIESSSFNLVNGELLANPHMIKFFQAAEPIVQTFQDNLDIVRVKTVQMLSMLDKRESLVVLDNQAHLIQNSFLAGSTSTPTTQFLIMLNVLKDMSTWMNTMIEQKVTYHITREQMCQTAIIPKKCSSERFMKTDRGLALCAWDCKMAMGTRSMLNNLVYNYIVIEDILMRVDKSLGRIHDDKVWKLYT